MKNTVLFIIIFLSQIAFVKIEASDCSNMGSHQSHSGKEKISEQTYDEREMKISMALARLKKESGDTTKADITVIKEEEKNKNEQHFGCKTDMNDTSMDSSHGGSEKINQK